MTLIFIIAYSSGFDSQNNDFEDRYTEFLKERLEALHFIALCKI